MNEYDNYLNRKRALNETIKDLKSIMSRNIPKEIKNELKKIIITAESCEITKPALKTTIGEILNENEIKEIIENSTDYKWKLKSYKDAFLGYTPSNYVRDKFGYNVEDKDVKFICFERNARSRDELCGIDIICIPGFSKVDWMNDRASCGSDLLTNEKMKKFLTTIS